MKDAIFLEIFWNGQFGILNNMTKTAFILLSNDCNKDCEFCFYKQKSFPKRKNIISIYNYDKLLEVVLEFKFTDVVITGGEPMLKTNLLFAILKRLGKLNIRTSINTNGTLFNEKNLFRLKVLGLNSIYLSSRYFTDINPELIKYLKNNFNLKVIHVITNDNFSILKDIIKIISSRKIGLIIQPAYIENNFEKYQELSPFNIDYKDKKEMIKLIKKFSVNYRKEYIEILKNFFVLNNTKDFPKSCHMGKNDIVIYPDGEVFPCFHRPDIGCGNIFRDKFKEINKKIKKISPQVVKAECFGEHCISLFY